jgi:hypothetical protein
MLQHNTKSNNALLASVMRANNDLAITAGYLDFIARNESANGL